MPIREVKLSRIDYVSVANYEKHLMALVYSRFEQEHNLDIPKLSHTYRVDIAFLENRANGDMTVIARWVDSAAGN